MKPVEDRRIGSGDVGAILGFDRHKNAMAAWLRIVGLQREGEESESIKIGRALEEPIARLVADKHGWPSYRKAQAVVRVIGDPWVPNSSASRSAMVPLRKST